MNFTIFDTSTHACRPGCGACCIAPSISSLNKPAGVPCPHLTGDLLCELWLDPRRPAVCDSLAFGEACGSSRDEAMRLFGELEIATRP